MTSAATDHLTSNASGGGQQSPPGAGGPIERLLEQTGAIRRGHFVLSSGRHSDRYCQCAALFENPRNAQIVANAMKAKLLREHPSIEADVVLAPALGGVLWGYELARALGVRTIFAERKEGVFALRRGFALRPGERVLLAEDVVTTGGSVMELVPIVESQGAACVGIVSIADRSRGAFSPDAAFVSLVALDFNVYAPDDVPPELAAVPIDRPGSRTSPPDPPSRA